MCCHVELAWKLIPPSKKLKSSRCQPFFFPSQSVRTSIILPHSLLLPLHKVHRFFLFLFFLSPHSSFSPHTNTGPNRPDQQPWIFCSATTARDSWSTGATSACGSPSPRSSSTPPSGTSSLEKVRSGSAFANYYRWTGLSKTRLVDSILRMDNSGESGFP